MSEPIAIIGAGITGLAAAYVLSATHKVTIVARDLPGDLGKSWASPWAGAVFHPQSTSNPLHQAFQADSFKFYHALALATSEAAPTSESRSTSSSDASPSPQPTGVKIYPMTEYFDDEDDNPDKHTPHHRWYASLMPDYRAIPTSELPPATTSGARYTSLAMNPLLLLPWLRDELTRKRGVVFIRREVRSVAEARAVTGATVVVNAAGVGAGELARDGGVRAVRGQTMFVRSGFGELVMKEGKSEYTYVIPRAGAGGVIMGGIKTDRVDEGVDEELKHDILRRVNRITGNFFKDVDVGTVEDIVGFRPGRKGGLRVEREGDVIHAYGVEGAGYIYSFGIAQEVKRLIEGKVKSRL